MSELWGWADLHTHPAAQLGFGGQVNGRGLFFGSALGPVAQALPCCTAAHSIGGSGTIIPTILDHMGFGDDGFPTYKGWPRYETILHQQMHVDGIERAWRGGLRLMVAAAVNNELFGALYQGGTADVGDDSAIDRQIDEILRLAASRPDLMEVVRNPVDARAAIEANKIAIVLAIEVDSICGGRARRPADFDPVDAERRLDRWFAAGVRMLNVVHLADNALSGCAAFDDRFNLSNHNLYERHQRPPAEFWQIDSSPSLDGVQFLLGQNPDAKMLLGLYHAPYPDYLAIRTDGHANARGLSDGGTAVLKSMMRRGMMIDIEHMSQRAVNETIALASTVGYPLVSSHTGLRAIAPRRAPSVPWIEGVAHEGMKTDLQLQNMPPGSVVGIVTRLGAVQGAGNSSAAWARSYMHLIDQLGFDAVCIGSDFNGFGRQPGPRPGGNVAYGSETMVGTSETIERVKLGVRDFDINVDGLAHFGMMPDFVLDVAHQHPSDGLAPLFRGAERFIQAWELAVTLAPSIDP